MNAWKEKFQISTSCTLTEALKNQWIKDTEYQKWAAQYYKLPLLKDSFFEKYPPSADFLDKMHPIANASAIPFLEWNNILYVACLEPQEIPTDQKTVFFIVSFKNMESLWQNIKTPVKDFPLEEQEASSELLNLSVQKEQIKKNILKKKNSDDIEFKYIHPLKAVLLSLGDWTKILIRLMTTKKKKTKQPPPTVLSHSHKQSEKLKSSNKETLSPVKTPPLNKATSDLKKQPSIILNIDDKDSAQNLEKTKLTEQENFSGTLNKNDDFTQNLEKIKLTEKEENLSVTLNKDDDFTQNSEKIKSSPEREEEEKPILLNLNEESQSPSSIQKKNSENLEKDTVFTPIVLQGEEHENSNVLSEESSFQESNPSEVKKENIKDEPDPPPTPIALEEEIKNQNPQKPQDISEPDKDKILYHKKEDEKTSMHKESGSFVILDQNKATSLNQLSVLRRPLEETKKYVNSYILFVLKKDVFVPYKWSSHLKNQKKAPGSIQKPSIFRIVYMSKQAYFGHIAPTLTNNSFFNQWGFETLPKHILLIPFLDAEKQNVLGGYLGISETQSLPIKILSAVEQILKPLNSYYEDGSLLKKVS